MKNRKLTKAQRKAISIRMKASWARRRENHQETPKDIVKVATNVRLPVKLVAYGYEDGLTILAEERFKNTRDAIPTILDLLYGPSAVKEIRLEED